MADAAQLASLADETPEGRLVVVLPRILHPRPGTKRNGKRCFRTFHGSNAHERRADLFCASEQGIFNRNYELETADFADSIARRSRNHNWASRPDPISER